MAAPFNEQTSILGKRVVDMELKYDQTFSKLHDKMASIAHTLHRLEAVINPKSGALDA